MVKGVGAAGAGFDLGLARQLGAPGSGLSNITEPITANQRDDPGQEVRERKLWRIKAKAD